MARVETSVVINRPVEHVWSLMEDPANARRWQSWLLESEQTSDGWGPGATWRDERQFLGRRFETTYVVTAFETNSRYSFKSTSGPISVDATVVFESVEGGTRLAAEAEVDVGSFFMLAEPIIIRTGRRQLDADLAMLKELLEAEA